ncbi:hypothetical protein KP509_36G034700 [Ceratopteris richardii]|uniref:Uncharacterized protein n=1 Tax=Ceratopteris richardii TaxID=49495 RepID=A0A8T2QCJ4_CERRI|nr:hypothetical protein KP509_36G034700 [Ceratopteris richardii]
MPQDEPFAYQTHMLCASMGEIRLPNILNTYPQGWPAHVVPISVISTIQETPNTSFSSQLAGFPKNLTFAANQSNVVLGPKGTSGNF